MVQIRHQLSREKLRDLRSLDSVKIRRRKALCIVEGERSIGEADSAGCLEYIVVPEETHREDKLPLEFAPGADLPLYTLPLARFREISAVKAGKGVLGVARIPEQPDRSGLLNIEGRAFLFLLDGIQEPGNVGALIRTAWALGAAGVLLGEGTADPFSTRAVRASAGGVFFVPLFERIGPGEVEELSDAGYVLYAAQRGGLDYRSVRFPERSILALGNEGSGFSQWVSESGSAVGIPLAGGADSLNVVVAGGIIASRMVEN